MRRTVIPAQAGGEPYAAEHAVLLDERARAVLDELGDFGHSHSGLDRLAGICTDLAMNFCSTADGVVVEDGRRVLLEVLALNGTLLLARGPVRVAGEALPLALAFLPTPRKRLTR